jgi:hypothetical protein
MLLFPQLSEIDVYLRGLLSGEDTTDYEENRADNPSYPGMGANRVQVIESSKKQGHSEKPANSDRPGTFFENQRE